MDRVDSGKNPAPRPVEKWRIAAIAITLLSLTAATIYLLIAAPWPIADFIRWQAAHNNGKYYPKLTGALIFIALGILFIIAASLFSAIRGLVAKRPN